VIIMVGCVNVFPSFSVTEGCAIVPVRAGCPSGFIHFLRILDEEVSFLQFAGIGRGYVGM
jgi:hypothetical protein